MAETYSSSSSSLLFFFPLFIILLFKLIVSKVAKPSHKNHPPSPPSLPLIGHLHLLKKSFNHTLQLLSANYGDILLLRFGVRNVLIISSPSAAEECFTKNDIIFANRPITMSTTHLMYHMTAFVFTPYGELWRNLRRVGASEMNSPNFAVIRNKEVMLLLSQLVQMKNCGAGVKVELRSMFRELAYNITTMIICGKRYYGENVEDVEEARRASDVIRAMVGMTGKSYMGNYLPFLRWGDLGGVERKMKDVLKNFNNFAQDLVDKRREIIRSDDQGGVDRNTMIDHMLALQGTDPENYSDKVIKGFVGVRNYYMYAP